jgi:DEAD/DEAH box helicase domain-containing protein
MRSLGIASMEKNIVVLDLETQKTFHEVGRENLHKLKVSVVCIYDYLDDQYKAYEESQMMELEKRLTQAELVIGFNVRRFDMAVLKPYLFASVESFPVLDLMEEIEKVRGHRVSLQSVAQATLGVAKSGQGLDAVTLYHDGKMEELKKYCMTDVRITKDVYEYGLEKKRIYFISNRDWKKYEVPISWSGAVAVKKESTFPASLF